MPPMEKAFCEPLLADFTTQGLDDNDDDNGNGDLMLDDSGHL